jgi:GNAT superfamily N-acetyltransferase
MTDAADETSPAGEQHALNTELLNAELPDKRFEGPDYLEWLYDRNPEGGGIFEGVDEDGRRMAHYALIPQCWRNAGGPAFVCFSLNAVTRSGAQRKGYFVQIGHRIYERARLQGAKGILAVPNEKSTPGALKYLVDEYATVLEADTELLRRAGVGRIDLERAFIERDVVRHGAATLARGDSVRARRIVAFGRAVLPHLLEEVPLGHGLRILLALGPFGGWIARLAMRWRALSVHKGESVG